MAYTKPQQRKKEESKKLRGEKDKTKFIDLRFERWRVLQVTVKRIQQWHLPQRDLTLPLVM